MGSTMAVIVNQTEAKAKTGTVDSAFLIPGYPSSKLRAEKLVTLADGAMLQNGKGQSVSQLGEAGISRSSLIDGT